MRYILKNLQIVDTLCPAPMPAIERKGLADGTCEFSFPFGKGFAGPPSMFTADAHRAAYTREDAQAVVDWLNKRNRMLVLDAGIPFTRRLIAEMVEWPKPDHVILGRGIWHRHSRIVSAPHRLDYTDAEWELIRREIGRRPTPKATRS